ncbi:uncharacterized protein LOC135385133 [Ornithodoros turicata]|uniref:uncharacterized protein LOC135385133 n=1 Tax=Ornithodoros turicata TaxID=34597 RepID=UPI0031398969
MTHRLGSTLVFCALTVTVAGASQDTDQEKVAPRNDFVLPALDSFPSILAFRQRHRSAEDELPYSVKREYDSAMDAKEPEPPRVSPPAWHVLFPRSTNVVLPGAIIVDPRHGILLPEGGSRSEMEPIIRDSFYIMERYLNKRNQTQLPIVKSRKRRSSNRGWQPFQSRSANQSFSRSTVTGGVARQLTIDPFYSNVPPKNNENHRQACTLQVSQNGTLECRPLVPQGTLRHVARGPDQLFPKKPAASITARRTTTDGLPSRVVFQSNDSQQGSQNETLPYSLLGLQGSNTSLLSTALRPNSINATFPFKDAMARQRAKRHRLVPVPIRARRNRRDVLPYYAKTAFARGYDPTLKNRTLMTTFARASEAVLQTFQSDYLHNSSGANRYPGELYNFVVDKGDKKSAFLLGLEHENVTLDEALRKVYEKLKAEDVKRFGALQSEIAKEMTSHETEGSERGIRRQLQGHEWSEFKDKHSMKKRHRGGGHRRASNDGDDTGNQAEYNGDVKESNDHPYRNPRNYQRQPYGVRNDAQQAIDSFRRRPLRASRQQGHDDLARPPPSKQELEEIVSVNGHPYVLIKDPEVRTKADEDEGSRGSGARHQLGSAYWPLNGKKVDLSFLNSLKPGGLITPDPAILKDDQSMYPLAVLFVVPGRPLLRALQQIRGEQSAQKRSLSWHGSKKGNSGLIGKELICDRSGGTVICYSTDNSTLTMSSVMYA